MRVKVMHRKAANGFYIGREVVPACPKTGAWLTPPDCVDAPPPVTIPAGYWPRWGGDGWRLARLPWRVRLVNRIGMSLRHGRQMPKHNHC